jgi:hypothetical protein
VAKRTFFGRGGGTNRNRSPAEKPAVDAHGWFYSVTDPPPIIAPMHWPRDDPATSLPL